MEQDNTQVRSDEIAFRAYLIMEKEKKEGKTPDEISAWVRAERELNEESLALKNKQMFEFYTSPLLPESVEIVGTVVTSHTTSEIHVSQTLLDHSVSVVTEHEQLHKSFLDGTLLPFEEIAYELQANGEEIINTEYISDFYIKHRFLFDKPPVSTTPKLRRGFGLLGVTPTNPIPVQTVYHEYRYLNELTWSDGAPVIFKRCGSLLSDVSKYPIDCFEIAPADNSAVRHIFITPYCKVTSLFIPEGLARADKKDNYDKYYSITCRKKAAYLKQIVSLLFDLPADGTDYDTSQSIKSKLVNKLLLSLSEFSLRPDDSTQLWNEITTFFNQISLWLLLYDVKWRIHTGNVEMVQERYKTIFKNIRKTPPMEIATFKEQLNAMLQCYPRKTLFSQIVDVFKVKGGKSQLTTNTATNSNLPGRPRSLDKQNIIEGYRRIFADGNVGASLEMSDDLIIEIYSEVESRFLKVAEERGELLETGNINMIVLYFLEQYRSTSRDFYRSHLDYEIIKYTNEGLRTSYQKPLTLF